MRVAIIGSSRDIHVRRWGQALAQAGAEVLYVGIEPDPEESLPYFCIGPPVTRPRLLDFLRRRRALREFLEEKKVEVAHPIYLTPAGIWVWSSGFRPYVVFTMGADVLEYGPAPPPLHRCWTLQGRVPTLIDYGTVLLRRWLLPSLLYPTLRQSLLILGDNYELCLSNKFFVKEKKYIELPTGIESMAEGAAEEGERWILSPRGATLLYQADIILAGYYQYLQRGGRYPLALLAGPYPIHPTVANYVRLIESHFPNMIYFFIKKIPKDEMTQVWARTVAFISAPVYDGYSYAVAEGRLVGALPIVNAIPAHLEVLTHGYNAWFVEPFTPEGLCEALFVVESLLKGPPFWRQPNAEWIQRFSALDRNAQLFLTLLDQALKAKK
ncbi:MAG: glycosyltransferase [Bacteroidia bacterium]|nr:hypothetical protein [Bacteroidia bacterium]MDW8015644.1 glycosyltransferase [Bacteroidia bacterium]